ncbi:hypothetical protein CDEST_14742 [Colletotrichum destructivum]|uniref:Uncharacterized protein n=1 Tax=Colletotrichum destructivum TaxID=34406 RepID=A0AAX4J2D8_9PEZI|nr:hypothetical protein CDEST_14742 [Colletotrichum destructivum]
MSASADHSKDGLLCNPNSPKTFMPHRPKVATDSAPRRQPRRLHSIARLLLWTSL